MGSQASKPKKARSRSTADSSSSTTADTDPSNLTPHHPYFRNKSTTAEKTPVPSTVFDPSVISEDTTSSQHLTDHDDSQLSGDTHGAGRGAAASKSNLSSFLNVLRNKGNNHTDGSSNKIYQGSRGVQYGGSSAGLDAEQERQLADLQEQKLQKKINRQIQREKEKADKLALKQTSHKPKSIVSSPLSPTQSSPHSQQQTLSPKAEGSPSSSLFGHSSRSKTASSTTQPKQKSRSSSKTAFIRGRVGFAWLEKRMPPASMGKDEEVLNDKTWDYPEERLLDNLEIEAAKGYVDRVTDQHYLMKDVMGGNYQAPIDLVFKRVLENGCGAGDWTLDMASEKPETDFVGCPQIMFTTSNAEKNTPVLPSRPRGLLGADQSQQGTISASALAAATASDASSTTTTTPTTTTTTMPISTPSSAPKSAAAASSTSLPVSNARPTLRPRNCYFHSEIPLNRLPFSNEEFDFVYQRRQCVVLMSTEWQRTVLELFRVLKRGGWVELLEPDLFLQGGGELCKLAGEFNIGFFEALGRNPKIVHEMQQVLESAGFINVSVKVFSIPLGWGGVIGQAMLVNQRQFVKELEPIYVRQGHGTSDDYWELTKNIFEEAVNKKAYCNYYVAVGQKPATESEKVMHQQQRLQEHEQMEDMKLQMEDMKLQADAQVLPTPHTTPTVPPMLVPIPEP